LRRLSILYCLNLVPSSDLQRLGSSAKVYNLLPRRSPQYYTLLGILLLGAVQRLFCYTSLMKHLESYLSKALVVSSIYLLAMILGGFFILPGVFRVESYNFPLIVELLLKVTSAVAVMVVLSCAIIVPGLKLVQKPKQRVKSPIVIAAATLLIGLIFIFLHGLYVKLRTCPIDGSNTWYCQVEGKSYVGMLVLAFFLASLVGFVAWAGQKLTKKK
jgi:hypothetical protein